MRSAGGGCSGRVDPGLIGGKVCGIADGLRAILASGSDDARMVLGGLRRRNIDLGEAKAVRLFGGDSTAGAQEEFTAQGSGVLIVAAPGEAMTPEAQDTATEIEVRIARASPRSEEFALLPDPLADARLDFEVPRSSARAYEVKEGDYIQIVDLFGRQCSDFHCLQCARAAEGDRARSRQHGDAHAAGARLSGAGPVRQGVRPGFPAAGGAGAGHLRPARQFRARLHGEILRGHGLSGPRQLLGQFQRRAGALWRERRRGWAALNLFYNTGIDHNNVLYLDEPWSRPGDFVLFRALTDLVCVSSACPDDIDAANGWNPTPVHIRTYPAKERFSRAVAFRMTPDAEPQMTKETAFHPRLSALTRNFTEYRGYWLPSRFNNEGPIGEYWACRERAVMIDLRRCASSR